LRELVAASAIQAYRAFNRNQDSVSFGGEKLCYVAMTDPRGYAVFSEVLVGFESTTC